MKMLNKKRYATRNKKENKNKYRNDENQNKKVILDLPLKQKKEQNITKKNNVKGRRKKEINNISIHNNEDQNDNSENINDNHYSLIRSQNNIEGNNNNNKRQNQNNKIINPENTKNLIKRAKSAQNLTKNIAENISIIPNNCDIFNKLELFNSLLLIINNNSLIKNYFSNDKVIDLIKKCKKNDKYSLSSILYYIGKNLWLINNKKIISQKNLLKKYKEYIVAFSGKNWEKNPDLNYNDINNIENIINFIYDKINIELSNSIDKINLYKAENNSPFPKYLEEFSRKNHSIISDHFMGHYQYQIICMKCKNTQYSYKPFMSISFNIKKIFDSYSKNNNNIKLNNCFNYLSNNNKIKKYNSFCEKCSALTNKKESSSIFILPNIITIVLTDNDYLMLEDKINLKNYVLKKIGNENYNLISILCQITYNGKFINYCINPNNGLWYCYTDGNIFEVDKIDINAIPLVLVYQTKSKIDFNYKPIKRESNKIKFFINFSNGIKGTIIYFIKDESFEGLYEKISSYFNLKDKEFILKINGKPIKEGQIINEFINQYNNFLYVLFN